MNNLKTNQDLLQLVNRHIHMLEQGILPPDIEKQALEIFKTREAAIEEMLKARRADRINVEHIIKSYKEADNE